MQNERAKKILDALKIHLYADGADFDQMVQMSKNPYVKGFTTNPSFMRLCGVSDYEKFGREILKALPGYPISLEVFADTFPEMESQARYIATWGPNVNVKIPVTNTHGEFAGDLIQRLSRDGIVLNITAMMNREQAKMAAECVAKGTRALISVFAGRVADAGEDPIPMMQACTDALRPYPHCELLWASTRETINIFQAESVGCKIITAPNKILDSLDKLGFTTQELSLSTVKTFHKDAEAAGYQLKLPIP